ncbi:MAG: hypothetical protein FWG36_02575 [Oscillospiraceae bacterium]|nr:hypothetical protein [Oscillospiraceae bacterium]
MQAQAYEGYFESGTFYTAGQPLRIPERKRVLIAILGDRQSDIEKQAAWNGFKQMMKDTEHENVLLDDESFLRRDSGRSLINFADER